MALILKDITYKIQEFEIKSTNLTIANGEYWIILGESGSGKTLLLDIIAGFRRPKNGSIYYKNKNIISIPIHKRKFAYVTSENTLFPNLTVEKNLLFANKSTSEETKEIINLFNISLLFKKYPNELSSGEKQKISLARAILSKPEILLLDEPLSAVDVSARYELILLLRQLHRKGFTIIHVTHNINEALTLSEKVAIMFKGQIIQTGTISEITKKPATPFVAKLTGIKNVYTSSYIDKNLYVTDNNVKIMVNTETNYPQAIIIISSTDIVLSKNIIKSSMQNYFKGTVQDIIRFENNIDVIVNIGILIHATITTKSLQELNLQIGQEILVYFKASSVRVLPYAGY
jgi:molybdopterin-binding protein